MTNTENQTLGAGSNDSLRNGDDVAAQQIGATIRIPMPPLNRENIELWFIQLDHWFKINHIKSDTTKFSTTIAALDANLIKQVYDIVARPPETNKFSAIKEAVIRNFADSEQRRIRKYVSGIQLGDRKPSHLLNDLRQFGDTEQNESSLKGLWMQRLPVEVQTGLVTVQASLSKLAELADAGMENFRVGNISSTEAQTATVERADASAATTCEISELRQEIRALTNRIDEMQRSGSRSRSHSRPRARPTGETECWYHKTFGSEAKNCKKPCSRESTATMTKR